MSFIGDLAEQTVGQVVGTGMGMATAGWQDRRQRKQAEKLQNINIKGQKEMGDYNYGKQMQFWNETNFGAQMEHLKKAGLNPGLLYKGSGAGGQTIGAPGGGVGGSSAAGGSGEIGTMMGIQMQRELLQAQKENIQADTQNKKAQAAKTAGVDTALGETQIKSLTAGVENTEAKTRLTKVETELEELNLELAGETYEARKHMIKYETDIKLNQLNILRNESLISDNTWSEKINIVSAELIGMGLKNELTKAQTGKTYSDINVNQAQIQNWLVQNAQGWNKLSLEERNTKVSELLGEFNTSLSREALGALGGVISTVIGKGMTKAPINTKTFEKKIINLPQGTKGFGGN